ncbi:hypothetical protein BC937DRAFT_87105 [Endogone sp. FLAS-F59071]|nr:hypothetical protein BC937DRAFT_87105 [Endogone sp. FLAS-F59071]|eukprot:RUS12753.1 hypothetical protein BC937DRAFT_87105 [Endogone sp. FLAS-F59071]
MKRQHSPLTTRTSSFSGRPADGPKRVPRGVPKTHTLAVTSYFADHNTVALSPPPPSPSPSRNHRHHPNAGLFIDTFQARQDRAGPAEEWTLQTLHALFDYPHDDHQTVVGPLSSLPSPTQSLPDSCSTPLSASTLSRSSTTSTTCTDDTNYSIQALSSCGREGDTQSPVRPTTTSTVLPRAMSAPLFTLCGSYTPKEPSNDINPCPPSDLGATTASFFVFDSPISSPTTSSSSTSDTFNTSEGYSQTWSTVSNRSLKRLHALHELFETERAYVRDLRILVEVRFFYSYFFFFFCFR